MRDALTFHAEPGRMTDPGSLRAALACVPSDVEALAGLVSRLVTYDVVAEDFYGLELPGDRASEIHLRPVESLLRRLLDMQAGGLDSGRSPGKRVVGRCRHYTLLMTAALRSHGVPARARCGFASYLNPPHHEDHWVCEYWDGRRWVLVDAQHDDAWRRALGTSTDFLDVPRDQFLVAAAAWRRCRAGDADPADFGISFVPLSGLWFIAGNLVRDVAALNAVEMLPWDVWGAQPRPDHTLAADDLVYFDELADLTIDPDLNFERIRERYRTDERLLVGDTVFNSLRDQLEAV